MNTTTAQFVVIEKESVSALHFPENDILNTAEEKSERLLALDRALSLGNLEHSKTKIYFEDDTSRKVVETTVWGVTDKRVILKQGTVIPIHRIHSIRF